MPEAPEVEAARRLMCNTCVGHTIEDVVVVEAGGGPRTGLVDTVVLNIGDITLLRSTLIGKVLSSANRKGKVLYFGVGEADALTYFTIHFGMTGTLSVRGVDGPHYALYSINTTNWPPRYTKLELRLSGGIQVALSDPWRLGRVTLLSGSAPLSEPPLSMLGPDVIDELPPLDTLALTIRRRRSAIKALLLQQDFLSGIGNWVADEVLYQASIHPATVAAALSEQDIFRLRDAIVHVLSEACSAYSTNTPFDKAWLYHYRWTKGQATKPTMPDGSPISFIEVGGRTTAFVATRQGEPKVLPNAKTKSKNADEAVRRCSCSEICTCKTEGRGLKSADCRGPAASVGTLASHAGEWRFTPPDLDAAMALVQDTWAPCVARLKRLDMLSYPLEARTQLVPRFVSRISSGWICRGMDPRGRLWLALSIAKYAVTMSRVA